MSLSNIDYKETKKSNWGTYGEDMLLKDSSNKNYQEEDILLNSSLNKTPNINLKDVTEYITELKKAIKDSNELEYYAIQYAKRNKITSVVVAFILNFILFALRDRTGAIFEVFFKSALTTLSIFLLGNVFVKPIIVAKNNIETLIFSRRLTEEHLQEVELFFDELKLLNAQNNELTDVVLYITEYARFLGDSPEKREEFNSLGDNK